MLRATPPPSPRVQYRRRANSCQGLKPMTTVQLQRNTPKRYTPPQSKTTLHCFLIHLRHLIISPDHNEVMFMTYARFVF